MKPTEAPQGDVLTEIAAAIQAAIQPAHADAVEAAATMARKVIYSKDMNQKLLGDISGMTADDPQKLAVGVMGVLSMLRADRNGRFEDAIMVPVASLVAVDLVQFLQQAEMLEPDTEFIGNVFEELYAVLMQKFHIEPADLQAMVAQDSQKARELDPNRMPQPGLINSVEQP